MLPHPGKLPVSIAHCNTPNAANQYNDPLPRINSFVNRSTELESNVDGSSSSSSAMVVHTLQLCLYICDALDNSIGCFVTLLCNASCRLRFLVLFTRSTWHYFSRLCYFFISGNLLLLLDVVVHASNFSHGLCSCRSPSMYSNIHYGVWFVDFVRRFLITRYGNGVYINNIILH